MVSATSETARCMVSKCLRDEALRLVSISIKSPVYNITGERLLLISWATPLAISPKARKRSCCITACWVWRKSS